MLGEQPSFITVSDRYAGYNYLALEQRQVCWAHLLRDFERIAGRSALAGQIGKRLLAYGFLLFRWRGYPFALHSPKERLEIKKYLRGR